MHETGARYPRAPGDLARRRAPATAMTATLLPILTWTRPPPRR